MLVLKLWSHLWLWSKLRRLWLEQGRYLRLGLKLRSHLCLWLKQWSHPWLYLWLRHGLAHGLRLHCQQLLSYIGVRCVCDIGGSCDRSGRGKKPGRWLSSSSAECLSVELLPAMLFE